MPKALESATNLPREMELYQVRAGARALITSGRYGTVSSPVMREGSVVKLLL